MKRVLGVLCVLAFLLGGYGVACAIPIEFSDFSGGFTHLSEGESTKWEHNIIDDGFIPSTDIIESASLTLILSDDLDFNCESWRWTYELEYGSLQVEDQLSYYLGEINLGAYFVELTALLQLQNSGLLGVTLTSEAGDFCFGGSLLRASAERAAPVPEPQTMLLFGCGLIGLAGFGRKRLLGRL